jgi:hypothetical protein
MPSTLPRTARTIRQIVRRVVRDEEQIRNDTHLHLRTTGIIFDVGAVVSTRKNGISDRRQRTLPTGSLEWLPGGLFFGRPGTLGQEDQGCSDYHD